MQPTSVLWRDLTMSTGQASRFRIRSLEGWEELPPARYDKHPRARAHGAHSSEVWADERLVTVEGYCWSSTERDQLLLELRAATTFDGGEEPLAITVAGRTLTAQAQLLLARPMLLRGEWGVGRFGWIVQWRCPDPVRYGPESGDDTGLPTSGGGLAYPTAYALSYGALGVTGQITLHNDGTADAGILATVTGPLLMGWEVSAAGKRLRYETAVPAGQVLDVDTDAGTVLAEGTADRTAELTVADWLLVPAGGELTLQFVSLGGAYDPAARFDARVKPTNW